MTCAGCGRLLEDEASEIRDLVRDSGTGRWRSFVVARVCSETCLHRWYLRENPGALTAVLDATGNFVESDEDLADIDEVEACA